MSDKNDRKQNMYQLPHFKTALALALAGIAFSPFAEGVTPAPDGGYPAANTAEGDAALLSLTTGYFNTAIGFDALYDNTTGYYNTAVGAQALFSNTGGVFNTATGLQALYGNTSGNYNTAYGVSALTTNTSGNYNTADGYNSLVSNSTGLYNTALGAQALFSNTTGNTNTATGLQALYSNTTGIENTADGVGALSSNTTGHDNQASGVNALSKNTTGDSNTANGAYALANNTGPTAGGNTANGTSALYSNTGGTENTGSGLNALVSNSTGSYNTAIGGAALSSNRTGNYNTAIGTDAGFNLTTGNYNINIGYNVSGASGEANTTRIGDSNQTKTFISGISGVTAASGVAVYVNSSGQLGTLTSSARYKEEIKPMDRASETIFALTPVTFRYKHEIDPDEIPQFGLVAEEVAKVNPDLVAKDAEGKIYTVRYEAVNAMLLNEFLKEHRKVKELEARLQKQEENSQKEVKTVAANLTSQIQKVSARLEAQKRGPQVVSNRSE
jgi:hypothetical protein